MRHSQLSDAGAIPHHMLDTRPPALWQTLRTTTLAAAANTITFDRLPTGYALWRLLVHARSSVAAEADAFTVTFNADTAANYDLFRYAQAGVSQSRAQNSLDVGLTEGDNGRAACLGWTEMTLYLPTQTTWEKSGSFAAGRMGDRSADADLVFYDGMWAWRATAAIHTITLTMTAGNFAAGSLAYLWGHLLS